MQGVFRQNVCYCCAGGIPSSDVAKVTGMMLHIGMEQMKEFVSVPGAVTVRPGDAREGELEVKVEGIEGVVDIPLM